MAPIFFLSSSWLVTLLSNILGFLALLFLQIIAGPCIINALTQYINFQLRALKVMIIKAQCEQVPLTESRI